MILTHVRCLLDPDDILVNKKIFLSFWSLQFNGENKWVSKYIIKITFDKCYGLNENMQLKNSMKVT